MLYCVFSSWPSCLSPLKFELFGLRRTDGSGNARVRQSEGNVNILEGVLSSYGKTVARPGDRFAIIEDPFSLTISCHPGERLVNLQKKRSRPHRLPGPAVHLQIDGECPQCPWGSRA